MTDHPEAAHAASEYGQNDPPVEDRGMQMIAVLLPLAVVVLAVVVAVW